jgi:hypothetical protein
LNITNPFSNKTPVTHTEHAFAGALVKMTEASTNAGSSSSTGNLLENRIPPPIPFKKRKEYYKSIGRVQNVTDSFVHDIINRGWYFDDDDEGKFKAQIEILEEWEESNNLSSILENMTRNWIIFGVNILSPVDWIAVQLESVIAKRRDLDGSTIEYIQMIGGQEQRLDATQFLEIPYIHLDRDAWPVGMFESLMFADYNDIDGKPAKPTLEYYRQIIQDESKVLHKIGSPRVIYKIPGANQEVIDNDIVPIIQDMGPGDRAIINENIEQVQEEVDGRTRFTESVQHVIDEVDTGMQSSKNRLITEPSAMADASEAGSQDDDRVLGLMEKLRRFMDREVIPRVTGLDAGEIQFKWGAKDSFDLVLPPALEKAVQLGILLPSQAAEMLTENFSWKIPEPTEEMIPASQLEEPKEKEPPNATATKQKESYDGQSQDHHTKDPIDRQIRNEKLVALKYINDNLREDYT